MRKWDLVLTPPNCLRPPHRVYRRRRVFPAPLVQHDELRHVELAAAEVTGAPCSFSCAQTTSSNKGGNRCYNTSFSQCIPKNGCPAHTHPQGLHQVRYVRVLLPQNVNTRDFWISLSSYFFHELGRKDDSRRDSNGTTAIEHLRLNRRRRVFPAPLAEHDELLWLSLPGVAHYTFSFSFHVQLLGDPHGSFLRPIPRGSR